MGGFSLHNQNLSSQRQELEEMVRQADFWNPDVWLSIFHGSAGGAWGAYEDRLNDIRALRTPLTDELGDNALGYVNDIDGHATDAMLIVKDMFQTLGEFGTKVQLSSAGLVLSLMRTIDDDNSLSPEWLEELENKLRTALEKAEQDNAQLIEQYQEMREILFSKKELLETEISAVIRGASDFMNSLVGPGISPGGFIKEEQQNQVLQSGLVLLDEISSGDYCSAATGEFMEYIARLFPAEPPE